jgi:hypothetical protein
VRACELPFVDLDEVVLCADLDNGAGSDGDDLVHRRLEDDITTVERPGERFGPGYGTASGPLEVPLAVVRK